MNARDEGPLIVYYDGDCGFCQRSVAWALARDRARLLSAVPSRSPKGIARLGEQADDAPRQIRAWSDREGLLGGIDAVAAMCARLPGWGWAAWALRFPPLRPFASLGYLAIAAVRRRLGGSPDACPLPSHPEAAASREERRRG